jgi:hypothetical protein
LFTDAFEAVTFGTGATGTTGFYTDFATSVLAATFGYYFGFLLTTGFMSPNNRSSTSF